jgi:pimeloyl-ACP methyl ester carboxylesterase
MTDDMTTTIEVDGIQIEIRRRGMGRPLVVIHGWSADHRYMMADLEPNFDNDDSSSTTTTWQRIYFDLPGHAYNCA